MTCTPLPETGFVRVKQIIAPTGRIPVSRSWWWRGVKEGRYPKPIKLSERVTAWRVSDIKSLIEKMEQGEDAA